MEIITENIDERKLMFNEYLENYLGDISFVKMNFIKYGFNSRNLNFHIRYDERKLNSRNFNKHSIYYGILEKEDFQVYFFGSDFELKKNDEKVNPSIAVSLNVNNLNQSCIVFGKDNESKIYLLMKIKFDNLKIHQKAVLETYNDILEIDEKHYINFVCFDNKIQILRNIRNFIQKIDVDKSEYNFINIKSITIPYEYIKMVGLPEDYNENNGDTIDIEKNNYCMICGHKILPNSQINKYLSKFMTQNPNKCGACFSKILISYFQSKVGRTIKDKTLFLSLVENEEIINFYIELSKFNGYIDKSDEIIFKQDLSEYQPFYSDIPDELLITENLLEKNEIMIKIHDKINSIEKVTIHHTVFNKKFKKLLSDYKLFPTDGHLIKNKLIDEVKKGNLNLNIDEKIMEYIIDFAHEKNYTNIFELSNKLNNLTLKNKDELNDNFQNKLKEHYLNEEDGWEIRNQLINEIDNLSISNVENLENRFNNLIIEKDKTPESPEIIENEMELIKEFLIINQECYLNTTVNNSDLNSILQLTNRLKNLICLNSMILTKISSELSKYEISFKIENNNVNIVTEILLNNGFQNLLKGDNHE